MSVFLRDVSPADWVTTSNKTKDALFGLLTGVRRALEEAKNGNEETDKHLVDFAKQTTEMLFALHATVLRLKREGGTPEQQRKEVLAGMAKFVQAMLSLVRSVKSIPDLPESIRKDVDRLCVPVTASVKTMLLEITTLTPAELGIKA
eukprot:TRINITY_DN420_c0_g1_i1.p1 TRINITY_DN420_c0_g1~~TRINITY_DN420_c0_g1_i1.p1  ORF type:complete len:156 (+),score=33.78 TRINITY_DN420_c0_g1_i1:28-468(+)